MADHEALAATLRCHAELAETSRDVVEVPVGLLLLAADVIEQSEARVRRVAEAAFIHGSGDPETIPHKFTIDAILAESAEGR